MNRKTLLQKSKDALYKLQQMRDDFIGQTEVDTLTFPESETEEKPQQGGIQTVDISAKSVARATLVIIGILLLTYFLYEIRGLLVVFFVSLFFASALEPSVDWMEQRRIPRPIGVILILLLIFSLFVVIIGSAIPIIVEQILLIVTSIADYFRTLVDRLQSGEGLVFLPEVVRTYIQGGIETVNIDQIFTQALTVFSNFTEQIKDLASGFGSTVGAFGAGVTSVTLSIAEFFFNLVLVFFLVFFMVVDKKNLQGFFQSLFPKKYGSYITARIEDIQKQIGAWLRGTFLLAFIMFALTFVSLHVIGMEKYALTLALIMGIGEMIPYIGPLIFLVFSLPVAFGISLMTVVKLLIFYVAIQFIEGNVLIPTVMKKVVGLSPIIVMLVLIIGWHFLGVIGAIIAVPVTTAVAMFIRDYIKAINEK